MRRLNRKHLAFAATTLASAILAGCGGSAPTTAEAPEFKGVFTTAIDCADSGKISYEDCAKVMSEAVVTHEADAPTYTSERSCVAKEGEGRCEFTAANGKYRPRLLAFLITASKPPTAKPLYAHPKGQSGFRDISNNTYTNDDEHLVFSEHAQTMFEAQAVKRR